MTKSQDFHDIDFSAIYCTEYIWNFNNMQILLLILNMVKNKTFATHQISINIIFYPIISLTNIRLILLNKIECHYYIYTHISALMKYEAFPQSTALLHLSYGIRTFHRNYQRLPRKMLKTIFLSLVSDIT